MVRIPWTGYNKEEKTFFMDRRILFPFILAGEDRAGDFILDISKDSWKIKQKNRLADSTMNVETFSGYGEWQGETISKELKLSQELKDLLLASNFCATLDPSLPQYHCVYIGKKQILASNSNVVFSGILTKENALEFPFPVGIIPLLSEKLVQSVGTSKDRVFLDCGIGYLEGTVSSEAKEKFPKESLLAQLKVVKKAPKVLALPGKQLGKALKDSEIIPQVVVAQIYY